MALKVRDVIKLIEADGWFLHHQTGSHRQYKHAIKSGIVTIAGKPGKDIPPGTLKSILNQSQIERG
jgi:predicted RNA binding protein YcfA (HicA-like mRNA interferase family)